MGLIYKILCNQTGEMYIGSTMDLKNRMKCHRAEGNVCRSKQIIDRHDYQVIILEQNNLSGIELLQTEQYYMDLHPDRINQKRAFTTYADMLLIAAEYYKNNRDTILEKKKLYYQRTRQYKIKKEIDRYRYKASWGGDGRSNNNLLNIDIDLFR